MSSDTDLAEMNEQTHGNVVVDFFKTLFSVGLAVLRSTFQSLMTLFWFVPGRHKDIRSDVILITGGGKGIGRLMAVEFAKYKPKMIILWGRHMDTLSATASVITMMGVPCDYMVCDVSIREQVKDKARIVKQKYGSVTILVNNAGVVFGNRIVDSDPEEMEKTLQVNTMAQFWTVKVFLPDMLRHDRGHVVFVNSMLGLMGLDGAADYSCSKFASAGFSESLKLEITKEGKHNVHVTSIHPFLIDNDMFAGCTTRFPRLLPALDPQYVAWKIVDSVLSNYDVVLLPRIMYLFYAVKSMLPMNAVVALHRFVGVDKAMDNFHGRKAKKL